MHSMSSTERAYYKKIDNVVRQYLENSVYAKELRRAVAGFRKTSLASRTAHARRNLRAKGDIAPSNRGYWNLAKRSRTIAKRQTTGTIHDFAEDVIATLEIKACS